MRTLSITGVHTALQLFALTTIATAQDWAQSFPVTAPPARNACAMVYDLARQQTLLFGGAMDGSVTGGLNDTWTWDGTNWTQQSPNTVPPTRAYASISYDLARGVVVMFGGRIHGGPVGPTGAQNDTWEWNGTDWTQIVTPTAPGIRYSAPMAYDIARGVHVLFSGVNASNTSYDETWEYDGLAGTWTQKFPANSPGGRVYSTMAYDSSRARIVVYGGADDSFVVMPDVFWEYDGVDWTPVTPTSTPGGVQGHVMAFDHARQRVVLQGGRDSGFRTGTWEYDGRHTYFYGDEPTPAPVNWHASSAFDLSRARTILFGGYNASLGRGGDTWEREPQHAAFATFGQGCAGSAGTPGVDAQSLPVLGTTFTLDVTNVPTSSVTQILFGFNNSTFGGATPLPLDLTFIGAPGCELLTSIDAVIPTTSTPGGARFTIAIPLTPTLAGQRFYCQAFVVSASGLILSNAGESWMH